LLLSEIGERSGRSLDEPFDKIAVLVPGGEREELIGHVARPVPDRMERQIEPYWITLTKLSAAARASKATSSPKASTTFFASQAASGSYL
jgi:hypothetical protein